MCFFNDAAFSARATMVALVSALLIPATPAAAGPVPTDRIPAEAKWFVHFDNEAFERSSFFRALGDEFDLGDIMCGEGGLTRQGGEGSHEEIWQRLASRVEFDWQRDVRDFTIMNLGSIERDMVMMVSMRGLDEEHLISAMRDIIPGYRTVTLDGHTFHAWSEVDDDVRRHFFGALLEYPATEFWLGIVGENWEHLLETMETIKGNAAAFDRFDEPDGPPRPGRAMMYMYIDDFETLPKHDKRGGRSPMRGEAVEWFALRIADHPESPEQLLVQMEMRFDSREKARTFSRFMDGMAAMLEHIQPEGVDIEPLRDLARRVTVAAEAQQVEVALALDVELTRRLVGMAREMGGDGGWWAERRQRED